MSTPTNESLFACRNELQKAEEDAKKWTHALLSANNALLNEKALQLNAERNLFKAKNDLKKLRAENPYIILKNQQKSLQIALKSLAENKNKMVIGVVEMMTIGVTLCALTMTTIELASPHLFLTLISFKMTAMSCIGSIVGSSGFLGWKADKKAALTNRMAEDNVKAAKTAINNSKIRCQDYKKQLHQKISEIKTAQQNLEKANDRVKSITETIHSIEIKLNKANRVIYAHKKLSDNTNITFTKPAVSQEKSENTDPISAPHEVTQKNRHYI